MSRLYVYALVDRRLARRRLRGRLIDSIPVEHVYAMAQRTDHAPALSEDALREQHQIVLRLAGSAPAILPARFGSLVDDEELRRIVRLRREQLDAAFDLVRGREQMTVRLLGEAARSVAPVRTRAAGSGPGARYLESRRTAAGYPLPDAAGRLTAAVRGMIAAEKSEPGQRGVRAMLYHLIDRGCSRAYCRALANAAADIAPFTVKVTGPWPPFAFVPELLE